MLTAPPTPKIELIQNGHWTFDTQMGSKDKLGFIYVIRDSYLERFYLGKKFYRGQRGNAKGVESNWKKYLSSSNLLKELFAERPREEFDFICLEEYTSKSGLSWAETWTLCFVEAPTTKIWYNTRVEKVAWTVKEHVTEAHKERLAKIINMEKL
jgi:hypothetical protein